MKQVLLQAMQLNNSRTKRQWWQRFVRTMAIVVVFCTTYALILPAITMEEDPICGQEGHTHTEECYLQHVSYEYSCGLDGQTTVVHSHDSLCRNTLGELVCTMAEHTEHVHSEECTGQVPTLNCQYSHTHGEGCTVFENLLVCGQDECQPHTHSEACVGAATNLICQLPEAEGHLHSESCTGTVTNLICTLAEDENHTHGEGCYETSEIPCELEETEGHTHGEGCFETVEIPCQLPETEGHIHSESCYELVQIPCTQPTTEEHVHDESCYVLTQELSCERTEITAHTHGEGCFDGEGTLVCQLPEIPVHQHSEACATPIPQGDPVLICQLPEHTHTELCYPLEEQDEGDPQYLCGSGVHTHVETCYDAEGTLTCSIPEHAHEAACLVADVDLTADLESESQWEATLGALKLTGNWPMDLLAVAHSQIGYTESAKNVVLVGQELRGYTRYGDWYGNAHQPWENVFVLFCLNYAGIPQDVIPRAADTAQWFSRLEEKNLLNTISDGLPQPGSILFCRNDQGRISSGIAQEQIIDAGSDQNNYRVIAGDVDGRVAVVKVAQEQIVAFCNPDDALAQYELVLSGVDLTPLAPDSQSAPVAGEDTAGGIQPPEDAFPQEPDGDSPMAETRATEYTLITANPAQLQTGVDYIIYMGSNNTHTLLGSDSALTPIAITTGYWTSPYTIGNEWKLTPASGKSWAEHTWRLEKSGNNTYLVSRSTGQRLTLGYSLSLGSSGTALSINANGAGATISGNSRNLHYSSNDWTASRWSSTTVYFAQVQAQEANYPHAVHTGEVNINRLRFFNICENGDNDVSALAGCVFEIVGDNGYTATVTSKNEPEVSLPEDIPDGNYTITEISAPLGYIRDTEFERAFTIKNGALANDATIGTFINHSMEQLEASKTAQVEDYANRIYQVLLSADSHLRMYQMDPMDLLFVVDQSNSMLFPSGLKDTGKRVVLRRSGQNNAANLDALNLDKSKMHYVIADPKGTSTVWAVWHDGTAWMCQDASYYAKAKHNNDPGYQDDNEIVIFPSDKSYSQQSTDEKAINSKYRSNGCGIGRDLGNSSLGKYIGDGAVEFVVYQSTDEYNRLHYLEESLANLIYEMADVNDENRITLTRFSRYVDEEHCLGPLELTPENSETLVNAVTSIKTSGGTRQDRALEHVYTEHLNDPLDHYKDFDHNYTILITDGAPVVSGDDEPGSVGSANDKAGTNTVYGLIKEHAADVRSKSHLMTVALGMESVDAGKQVLQEIASDGSFYCALDDAAQLIHFVQKLLFESFRPKDEISLSGDIVDEISDSFYPIAWVPLGSGVQSGNRVLLSDETRDWVLLEENDWITLEGKLTTAGAADAAGQLLKQEDGTYYVKWANQNVTHGWNGTFYVKAKEDFIGGNAIDTNKEADVTVHESHKSFETPTVNVRLLDMNEMHSEITVYLGDLVNGGSSPLDSLKSFYENTVFSKLIADGGDILNRQSANSTLGLEEAVFYLRYAMGRDLTEEEWEQLANGDEIVIPYTYDDDSSHGPVGEFTFRLSKTGLGSSYNEHASVTACQPGGEPSSEECLTPAETYTLHITYDAYELGENGRPGVNVHNGTGSPGTEVGTGQTLPTGLGTVAKENVHEVHVISGKIEIIKRFADGVTDPQDKTFTFTLHRVEDGADTSRDVTKTITIPANGTAGTASIVFDNLPRGTYTVTEAVDDAYALRSITVLNSTNAYSQPEPGKSGTSVTFVMGNNLSNENVIGFASPDDPYTSYVDPVNGVYGAAEFTNAPIVYTGEVPVEKIWDAMAGQYEGNTVYLVLYLDGVPVLDGEGNARILRLTAADDWKGTFTVTLANKSDSPANYNYSVREVNQISMANPADWHPAILENDGSTVIFYDRALEKGQLIALSGNHYAVEYGVGPEGQLTVTNYQAVVLPNTGGMGTTPIYTFGGLLILAAALMYVLFFGRKQQKGGV